MYSDRSYGDEEPLAFAVGHTTMNTPDPFRTPKLSVEKARLVLGSGTAWEHLRVLTAFSRRAMCCYHASSTYRHVCMYTQAPLTLK